MQGVFASVGFIRNVWEGRPAAPENGGRFAAGSLEVWRLGLTSLPLEGLGRRCRPGERNAPNGATGDAVGPIGPMGRRRWGPSPHTPGRRVPRRRKGPQGTGHFAVRPCGPLYRAHPLRPFRFPACGSTPSICNQSAQSAVPLRRVGRGGRRGRANRAFPAVVKGRVDGGGRPRRIARTLCVFAEKGRLCLRTSTLPNKVGFGRIGGNQ